MQKLYIKNINGLNYIKPRNEIIINKGDNCIYNPTNDILLENGWSEYDNDNSDTVEFEDDLQSIKDKLKKDIIEYDLSAYVNTFYINGTPLWFDKNQRSILMQRFNAEKYEGLETTKMWYNDDEYSYEYILSINDAINILYKLEVYAANCYDITQSHLNNIGDLNDKESIKNYEYYTGYPEPLHFDI